MAEIGRFLWWRHLRSETNSHVIAYSNGRLTRSGRGLAFWFLPMRAAIAEVPVDDRDQPFLFHAKSADYEDVTVHGSVTYRVEDAARLAARVNFAMDLVTGEHLQQPLDQIATLLTGLVQQGAQHFIASHGVLALATVGLVGVQGEIGRALFRNPDLEAMGVTVVAAQAFALKLPPELAKALSMPVREQLQGQADGATFERRAAAVEKERAIEENQLQNQIELARREEQLIRQRGANERHRIAQEAEAGRIAAEAAAERAKLDARTESERVRLQAQAKAERLRLEGDAKADRIRAVEGARAEAEAVRLAAHRGLPPAVLATLAVRDVAGKLTVEHLNVTPDFLGPALGRLAEAGARHFGTSTG